MHSSVFKIIFNLATIKWHIKILATMAVVATAVDKSLFCVLASVSVHKCECKCFFRCLYAFIFSYSNAVVSLVLLERMQLLSLTFSYLIFQHYLLSVRVCECTTLCTDRNLRLMLLLLFLFSLVSVRFCACLYNFVLFILLLCFFVLLLTLFL